MLIDWGFREYDNYELLTAGETVQSIDVWLGTAKTIPIILEQDLKLTLLRSVRKKLKVSVVVEEPVPAPITKGQRIATLKVTAPNMEIIEVPLVAAESVGQLGIVNRVIAAVCYLIWGASG
jgi:D-alanyl-D-alanine carboxypeptidase (penicillin-binding protein 5/6)